MILVYTGDGKGKTTAALGAVFRALGHGKKVLVIQFFKGEWPVVFGEWESAKLHPNLDLLPMGRGFVNGMGDKKPLAEHQSAARAAFDEAKTRMASGKYDVIVLDEVIYALGYADAKLIEPLELLEFVRQTPQNVHLILTGRSAPAELIEAADLVTEMREVKHPYKKGMPAQLGIDY